MNYASLMPATEEVFSNKGRHVMQRFSLVIISIFLTALFSTAVYAKKPADNQNSSNNDICAPLKAKGVTKGLYGLCVAYHSGANSQAVLDNYNKKKTSSDPVMPGTEENPPTLNCACWNTLTAEEIGADLEALPPSSCFLSPEVDLISYDNFDNPENVLTELLYVAEGYCAYSNSVTETFSENSSLTPEQEADCRLEILDLAIRDFQGFDCLPEE